MLQSYDKISVTSSVKEPGDVPLNNRQDRVQHGSDSQNVLK